MKIAEIVTDEGTELIGSLREAEARVVEMMSGGDCTEATVNEVKPPTRGAEYIEFINDTSSEVAQRTPFRKYTLDADDESIDVEDLKPKQKTISLKK